MVCVLGLGAGTASAFIPYPIDWHYIWHGPDLGWEQVADPYGYGAPIWQQPNRVYIPNFYMPPPWHKNMWVEPVWPDPWPWEPPVTPPWPGLIVEDEFGTQYPSEPAIPGYDDWTYPIILPLQPAWEYVIFPVDVQYIVGNPLIEGPKYIEFGTYCVPEPATLGLLTIGGVGALLRRRR